MPVTLKASPIVVDYQRERYESENSLGGEDAVDDGHSALFYLSVWALSAGLFLTAFYVASEAPLRDESGGHAIKAVAARHGLAMAAGRTSRARAEPALEARVGSPSENRR